MLTRYIHLMFLHRPVYNLLIFLFYQYAASPEIYTLSLHDALPISREYSPEDMARFGETAEHPDSDESLKALASRSLVSRDRKSTRLNSSHRCISYAVFCLKKKKR